MGIVQKTLLDTFNYPKGILISMSVNTQYIFPGRFQPFHNGHMEVISKILSDKNVMKSSIVMGVIVNQVKNNSFHTLANLGNEHHQSNRNPFTLCERLCMLNGLFSHLSLYEQCNLVLTGIPRPELHWEIIVHMFPGHRTWIVPLEGEHFDDEKERFFKDMGDEVLRIRTSNLFSGRLIRESLKEDDSKWENMVPQHIFKQIKKMRNLL